MGWNSGGGLMDEVIRTVQLNVPSEDSRLEIYKDLIEAFESMDCDVLMECIGQDSVYDGYIKDLYRKRYPEDFGDEEYEKDWD